jgi:diphosphomevalonate decarboxylase
MWIPPNQATARAHPNIAFIKYWGNQDDNLRLPASSSISMNLDGLYTETTVAWDSDLKNDYLILNGREQRGDILSRVRRHLDFIRQRLNLTLKANVSTVNNFPMGVGIASSASSSAALTLASIKAAGVEITEKEMTTIARLGSGSAARSIPAGYVQWYAGAQHEDSFAESFASPDHWGLVDVIAVISEEHKRVGSTDGHQSARTSDLQGARLNGAERRFEVCKQAIIDRDFDTFAEVVELDSNLMHAVMMTSHPPLFYWLPMSLKVMATIKEWRREGVQVCYTLDAGPNVHCICVRNDAGNVSHRLETMSGVQQVRVAAVGGGAYLV